MHFHKVIRSVMPLAVCAVSYAQRPATSLGFRDLDGSSDVAYLQRVASGIEEPLEIPAGRDGRAFTAKKDASFFAYARLAQLETEQSLAAVQRVETDRQHVNFLPATVNLGVWPKASFNTLDSIVNPLVKASANDGTTYALLQTRLLGREEIFVTWTKTPDKLDGWSRPIPSGLKSYPMMSRFTLSVSDNQALLITYQQDRQTGTLRPSIAAMQAPEAGLQKREISLARIRQDSDKDGYTDLEEQSLGLDPIKPDTDGDGMADGQDPCPDYAFPADIGKSDQSQVIQLAVFASFGLSGSHMAIRIEPEMGKIPLWGIGRPVLYKSDPRQANASGNPVMSIGWMVRELQDDHASVLITYSLGGGMAGSQQIQLKKIGSRWYVIKRSMQAAS